MISAVCEDLTPSGGEAPGLGEFAVLTDSSVRKAFLVYTSAEGAWQLPIFARWAEISTHGSVQPEKAQLLSSQDRRTAAMYP